MFDSHALAANDLNGILLTYQASTMRHSHHAKLTKSQLQFWLQLDDTNAPPALAKASTMSIAAIIAYMPTVS